jgi:hypothetical protein
MRTVAHAQASPRPHDWLDALYRGQSLLAGVGLLLLLMMIPTFAAWLLDGRTLDGISVWIKPLKFQASLAVQFLTVAWLMLWLPPARRHTRLVSTLALSMSAAALLEIGYISHQSMLGQGSHFNLATPYTQIMYALMGAGALVLVGATGTIGWRILRDGDRSDPMVLAAGIGLVLGSILGLVTGASLSLNQEHWVGGLRTDAAGLPIFGWSRTGGDLRVAHFFGLHMMQALPLAALLAGRLAGATATRRTIWIVAILGIALTAATYVQALMGLPLVPL